MPHAREPEASNATAPTVSPALSEFNFNLCHDLAKDQTEEVS